MSNRKTVGLRREYVKENIIRMEIQEIADAFMVHKSTIEKDLIFLRKEEKLPSKSELRDMKIKQMHKEGFSVEKIAEYVNVTTRDVYYRLAKLQEAN